VSVGRIIAGKYCLLQQLGHGAMGSVWAAEHLTLRSQVAVKLIQPQALAGSNRWAARLPQYGAGVQREPQWRPAHDPA
jgi:hypothetical protein